MKEKNKFHFTNHIRTALHDGTIVKDSPMHMATELLYKAEQGDIIEFLNIEYLYAIALFSLEFNKEYIYTYNYQREGNWTTYQKNVTPDSYIEGSYAFEENCYFRI